LTARIKYLLVLSCIQGIALAQSDEPIPRTKISSLIFTADYTYNPYFGNKEYSYYPTPTQLAGGGAEQYKSFDTQGYNLGVYYSFRTKRKFSFTTGLIFCNLNELQRYSYSSTHNSNGAQITELMENDYGIIIPLFLSYTQNRFMISAGIKFPTLGNSAFHSKYADNSESVVRYSRPFIDIYYSASIYFRLLRNKNIYLNVGCDYAVGDFDFSMTGYIAVFNAGLTYKIDYQKKK